VTPPFGSPLPGSTPKAALPDNTASALCYALGLITGVLFLVLQPYSQNRAVRFHAFQSIFLNVAVIIAAIILGVIESIAGGLIGWWFASAISGLFDAAVLVVWIVMGVTTYQGRSPSIPFISPLAQQQV
jgi:uncharacterized membrane protein